MKSSTENIMATESGDSAEEMSINEACLPQKKFYRQRAHSNPLSKWVVFIYVYYFWILLINRLLYSRWPLIWLVSFVPWMKIYIFNKKKNLNKHIYKIIVPHRQVTKTGVSTMTLTIRIIHLRATKSNSPTSDVATVVCS